MNHLSTEEMSLLLLLATGCFIAATTSFTVPTQAPDKSIQLVMFGLWANFLKFGHEKTIYLSFFAFVQQEPGLALHQDSYYIAGNSSNTGRSFKVWEAPPPRKQPPLYKHCILNQDLQKYFEGESLCAQIPIQILK